MNVFKNLFKTFLVLFATVSIVSCSSDDDDSSQVSDDLYVDFTIDGTDYHFTNVLTAESTVITINGNNGSSFGDAGDTQIALWLPLEVVEGTFDVTHGWDADYQVSFSSDDLNFSFDFAESGSITVTEANSDYIEGSFSATVSNGEGETISLENGTFRSYGM